MEKSQEDVLAMAARHVEEGEERIARQEIRIEEMIRDGHEGAAAQGQRLLEAMRETLRLSREHLALSLRKDRYDRSSR